MNEPTLQVGSFILLSRSVNLEDVIVAIDTKILPAVGMSIVYVLTVPSLLGLLDRPFGSSGIQHFGFIS